MSFFAELRSIYPELNDEQLLKFMENTENSKFTANFDEENHQNCEIQASSTTISDRKVLKSVENSSANVSDRSNTTKFDDSYAKYEDDLKNRATRTKNSSANVSNASNANFDEKFELKCDENLSANVSSNGLNAIFDENDSSKFKVKPPKNIKSLRTSSSSDSANFSKYRQQRISSEDEESDRKFEQFLLNSRPSAKPKTKNCQKLSDFIVDDQSFESSESETSPTFYRKTLNERILAKRPRRRDEKIDMQIRSSIFSEVKGQPPKIEEENFFKIPSLSTGKSRKKFLASTMNTSFSDDEAILISSGDKRRMISSGRMRTYSTPQSSEKRPGKSRDPALTDARRFLSNLSKNPEFFARNFKRNLPKLVEKLYKIFNTFVFDRKLPENLRITFNSRLTTTAGLCKFRYSDDNSDSRNAAESIDNNFVTFKTPLGGAVVAKTIDKNLNRLRTATIDLSTKVCDTVERVRDTLVHEMCHAAVWILDGDKKGGHGPAWKSYASKANRQFVDLLPPILRCHNYEIAKKFTYTCQSCGQRYHRHSKSIDLVQHRCGRCHQGRFELTVNSVNKGSGPSQSTQQTPRFALFVKENYGSMKKLLGGGGSEQKMSHREIMTSLGQQFKQLMSDELTQQRKKDSNS